MLVEISTLDRVNNTTKTLVTWSWKECWRKGKYRASYTATGLLKRGVWISLLKVERVNVESVNFPGYFELRGALKKGLNWGNSFPITRLLSSGLELSWLNVESVNIEMWNDQIYWEIRGGLRKGPKSNSHRTTEQWVTLYILSNWKFMAYVEMSKTHGYLELRGAHKKG